MKFRHLLNLTKPRISIHFALTGLAAMVVEGSWSLKSLRLWLIVLGIFMVGGAANALNQFFEREVDSQMARTAKKRSLPLGLVTPTEALVFSVALALGGLVILAIYGGWLATFWGVFTILFYSFYYTLWLKPRTPYNIVIGGAAGAMGPLIGWAAVTGNVGIAPLVMFLIIFFWTPPHFWALALCCKEDYQTVSYPMLPNVVGDDKTRDQIVYYSYSLLPLSALLYYVGASGKVYLVTSFVLSLLFILGALRLRRLKTTRVYWQFFAYSIVYLLLLFMVMIVDHYV